MSDPDRLAKVEKHLTDHQDIHEDDGWWLLNHAADALGEVERLRGLIARLEWEGGDDFGAACPECQAYRESKDGHVPGCELAAALAGRVTHHDLLPGNEEAPLTREG